MTFFFENSIAFLVDLTENSLDQSQSKQIISMLPVRLKRTKEVFAIIMKRQHPTLLSIPFVIHSIPNSFYCRSGCVFAKTVS